MVDIFSSTYYFTQLANKMRSLLLLMCVSVAFAFVASDIDPMQTYFAGTVAFETVRCTATNSYFTGKYLPIVMCSELTVDGSDFTRCKNVSETETRKDPMKCAQGDYDNCAHGNTCFDTRCNGTDNCNDVFCAVVFYPSFVVSAIAHLSDTNSVEHTQEVSLTYVNYYSAESSYNSLKDNDEQVCVCDANDYTRVMFL